LAHKLETIHWSFFVGMDDVPRAISAARSGVLAGVRIRFCGLLTNAISAYVYTTGSDPYIRSLITRNLKKEFLCPDEEAKLDAATRSLFRTHSLVAAAEQLGAYVGWDESDDGSDSLPPFTHLVVIDSPGWHVSLPYVQTFRRKIETATMIDACISHIIARDKCTVVSVRWLHEAIRTWRRPDDSQFPSLFPRLNLK
jgi:hypothetical protein